MPKDNEDRLHRTASLARLELSEAEASGLARDFDATLKHFEALASLEVEGVEPTLGGTSLEDVRREDTPRPSMRREDWMGVAPDARDGFLAVPKTLEERGS